MTWQSADSQPPRDTEQHTGRGEVQPVVETIPKERVAGAYHELVAGDVRFNAKVTYSTRSWMT